MTSFRSISCLLSHGGTVTQVVEGFFPPVVDVVARACGNAHQLEGHAGATRDGFERDRDQRTVVGIVLGSAPRERETLVRRHLAVLPAGGIALTGRIIDHRVLVAPS